VCGCSEKAGEVCWPFLLVRDFELCLIGRWEGALFEAVRCLNQAGCFRWKDDFGMDWLVLIWPFDKLCLMLKVLKSR